MSWRCICIVVPGINALADEDQEQDPDRWASHSASGQEAWQLISQWVWNLRAVRWGISWLLTRCVPPSLLQHSHRSQHKLPLLRALLPLRWACAGSLAASRVKTLPSSQMAPSVALPGSRWLPMSGAGKPMGACVWCMQVASAIAARVRCASSVF
jgi:hypothetical protein